MGGIPLSYSEKVKWEACNIKRVGREKEYSNFKIEKNLSTQHWTMFA